VRDVGTVGAGARRGTACRQDVRERRARVRGAAQGTLTRTRVRIESSASGPGDNAALGAGVGRHATGALERPNEGTGAVNSTLTAFFFKNLELCAPRCK
jgi:hypothetical protein